MTFLIPDDETPSSLYAGYAKEIYRKEFVEPFQNKIYQAKEFVEKVFVTAIQIPSQIQKGFKFFVDWFNDDPIPAAAAAIAVGASLGLVAAVGTAVVGSVAGGMAAMRGLTLLQKIKLGLAAVGILAPVGALIRFMIRGVQYMWNFNWNMSDSDIRKKQDEAITSLYGLAGSVVGSSLATLLCGVAPVQVSKRAGLIKVNPMTLAMIREITEFNPHSDEYGEIYEEMMEAMKALIRSSARVTAQVMFLESYKNLRKFIKNGFANAQLALVFPKIGNALNSWGTEGSQSWSFAEKTEEWLETIEDKKLQNFAEEVIESFMDTCTENSMVVSYLF